MTARHLSIDIETRSACDLRRTNAYVYAEDMTTDIILCSYQIDDGPVQTWYIIWELPMPEDLRSALLDPECAIHAWNYGFERTMLLVTGFRRGYVGADIARAIQPFHRWHCSAATASYFGLPRSLENAARALGLDQQKDKEGAQVMLRCCSPIRRNMDGSYSFVEDAASIFRLGQYCERDVLTETAVRLTLPDLPAIERPVFEMTGKLNDRGILADAALLEMMVPFVVAAEAEAGRRLHEVTGGAVPKVTSVPKIKEWLASQGFPEVEDTGIGKDALRELLENPDLPDLVREVLVIRKEGGKSSAAKYKAIDARRNVDSRCRGTILYCGAASSNRFSGVGVQTQNLARGGTITNIDGAVDDILNGADIHYIREKYGPPMVVASEIVRPTFKAAPDHWLARGDYSQVELRVGNVLAGQDRVLETFRKYDNIIGYTDQGKPLREGPDVYRVTAAGVMELLGRRVDPAEVEDKDRQIYGKITDLSLIFGGALGAFQAMARVNQVKIPDDVAEMIVGAWRERNPGAKAAWKAMESAAKNCIRGPVGVRHDAVPGCWFIRGQRAMMMRRPSGRVLTYWGAHLRPLETKWGVRDTIRYFCENSQTRQWQLDTTYGGALFNNLDQSSSRDIMADALVRLEDDGLRPVLTVHDEAVCELPKSQWPTAESAKAGVTQRMVVVPEWMPSLPLAVDASAGPRYVKA